MAASGAPRSSTPFMPLPQHTVASPVSRIPQVTSPPADMDLMPGVPWTSDPGPWSVT